MTTIRNALFATAAAIGLTLVAMPAEAAFISAYEITSNSSISVASQISIEVTDVGGQVRFEFKNNVGLASSITQIYFDDTTAPAKIIFSSASLTQSAGVDFSASAGGNLPGGNQPAINFSADENVSANAGPGGVPAHGINAAGETLDVLFSYNSSDLAGVLADLASGELRIGFHVQALSDGQSESYVSCSASVSACNPTTSVPVPGVLGLLGAGLMALGIAARRRRKD